MWKTTFLEFHSPGVRNNTAHHTMLDQVVQACAAAPALSEESAQHVDPAPSPSLPPLPQATLAEASRRQLPPQATLEETLEEIGRQLVHARSLRRPRLPARLALDQHAMVLVALRREGTVIREEALRHCRWPC